MEDPELCGKGRGWLSGLLRLAELAQVTMAKIDSALAPLALMCVWSAFAWGCGIFALWKHETAAFWAFFTVGCAPIIVALGVGVYFALTNPDLLRSGKLALQLEKLRIQQQGGASRIIDVGSAGAIANPSAKLLEVGRVE